jgi:hypothetical protein
MERSLPFLRTLRGTKDFIWGLEQEATFESLKVYLLKLTTLASLVPASTLLLYVTVSHSAVSAALVQERLRWQAAATTYVFRL